MYILFFFFQAEDGIRDLVRSRGLGDVYKRQELNASDSTQNLNTQAEAQPATQAIADGSSNDSSLKNQDKATVVKGDTVTTASGLRYIDIEKGKGKKVVVGMNLKIDYAGFFTDGKVFDTSIESVAKSQNFDRHGMAFTPFDVVIGKGSVIAGWDEGLTTNMNIGGKRRLLVPVSYTHLTLPTSDLV